MAAYLFVHFVGEGKNHEQIYFSLSRDGLHWRDLKDGKPVLLSHIGEQGVRDPFIVRAPGSGKYYLIATDLRIEAGKGWKAAQETGSRSMIVWESEDLIHWSRERSAEVGVEGAGCVWAPEAVYDEEKKTFMVFWASKVRLTGEATAKHRMYASYTDDFKSFSEPFVYLEKEKDVIDMTIVREKDRYYRFVKDETTGTIMMDAGAELDGVFQPVHSDVLAVLTGVEGPECYKLPDGTWCLIVDRFAEGKGYLPLLAKDLSKGEFEVLSTGDYYLGESKKRHGGVIEITDEQYDHLRGYYGANPVIDGLFADPDIAFFDGRYYIYPTSDGYEGWAGTAFSVFSSENGKYFRKERQILELAGEQVPWAVGSAWAPCIAEKNGKYYFYFCGKRQDGVSCIGTAVSDSPAGEFKAQSQPILTPEMVRNCGIDICQVIDPSIYQEEGKTYLLFGNGTPVIVELEDSMVEVKRNTMEALEGAYDFREAITVLKREGKYHFTWSCDDTGSENYHVNYGISDSLYGPIQYQYPVLEKTGYSLGTGHHAIVKVQKTNEQIQEENKKGKEDKKEEKFKIAYHRFATPLEQYPEGKKGFYREICMGDLEFDERGLMKPPQK